MRNRKLVLPLVIILSIVLLVGFVDAVTVGFEAPYDDGDFDYGYGGGANDYPGDGRCEIYMNVVGADSEVWCWIGSDLTFTSIKSVSMDADVDIKAYVSTAWPWGLGIIRIYLECRKTSDESLQWYRQVWSDVRSGGETHSYNHISPPLDTSDFPVSTPAGTYYFCCKFYFIGHLGAVIKYSSTSDSRAQLTVDSITVTY